MRGLAPATQPAKRKRGRPRKAEGERSSAYRPSGGPLHRIAKARGGRAGVVLAANHPAIVEARPLFPSTVVDLPASPRLLISGMNQRKIGRVVMKGHAKGLPIYTLTLAERMTCPSSCDQWRNCYGNNMPFARRHRLDDALIERLGNELDLTAARHPRGFLVRIHILGDFGSESDVPLALRYVAAWSRALARIPGLRIFGFTAHPQASEIGRAIALLSYEHGWARAAIRFSGAPHEVRASRVIEPGASEPAAITCPAQTGATDCCATCALCWQSERSIAFHRH